MRINIIFFFGILMLLFIDDLLVGGVRNATGC